MFILFISLFNLLLSQIIDHQFESNVFSGNPYEVKVYSDINPNDIENFNIYYRTNTSGLYIKGTLNNITSNYFSYIIPVDFISGKYLEYYILLESNDGTIKTIPHNDPYDIPISLRISEENIFIDEFQNNGLENNINIISPQPNQVVSPEDVFIALSYFRMDDIDISKTQVLLDDINITASADIYETNLTLLPIIKSSGIHQIKVILYNTNGEQYNPIIWNFYIESIDYIYNNSKKLAGKVWNDYVNNKVDSFDTYSNSTNFDLEYSTNWFNIRSKLKKSSLENNLIQAKDRYSINLGLNNININYGDFYPNFNHFLISGSRVRGLGFNYKSKFFQIDLISGELSRAVQGNSNNNAVFISDYTTNYICNEFNENGECISGSDKSTLDISRSGYTFRRDISGIRFGFGDLNKTNFGFNILKAKDQVSSVSKNLPDAIISLPYDYALFDDFNSDQFIDLDEDGQYTLGEDLLIDYNQNGVFDDSFQSISEIEAVGINLSNIYSAERIKLQGLTNYCNSYNEVGLCNEEEQIKTIIQWIWDIKVNSEDFQTFMSDNFQDDISTLLIDESIDIDFLDDQWDGNKPEDNLTLGTDFSFSSKNKNFKVSSSFAMSLLNENIWNPVKSVDDFDTYSDDYKDCEFGTLYDLVETPALLLDDCTDSYEIGGCNPFSDYYWFNCKAYKYINGEYNDNFGWEINDDEEIELTILEQGISLDAIPNPEDFADMFHYNFDAIPSIPFYSIIQKLQRTGSCSLGTCGDEDNLIIEVACNQDWSPIEDEEICTSSGGEWIDESESFNLSDLLNSPEVAYDVDFSLKLMNNQIKFGIKQVGQSFNTLGNPYLQKDMREIYFSDRIRLFENRMFITLQMSDITNGISDDDSPDISKKNDFNISYYPGINSPSFNLAFANYNRKSGQISEGYVDQISSEIVGAFDTRLSTQTNNFNISINYSFKSNGKIIQFIKSKIKSIGISTLNKVYQQNVTFTYFSSFKDDLLLTKLGYLETGDLNQNYLSPRSKSTNFGINLKTIFTPQWESNVNYSNSYFDYAQKNTEYFEKQRISTLSSSFNYKINNRIERVGAGIDYVNGNGTLKYNQYTLKVYSEFLLLKSMNLNIMYSHKIKNIISSDDYINSLFKINISYRF